MNSNSAATGMQFQGERAIPLVDTPNSRYVRFGAFHLDRQQQELFKDGSRVRVQGKVCEALMILIANSGEVVTRETLRAHLWPTDTQINYDANVNTTVNKLRQVLGDSPERPAFVETIPRKGYTFIAVVESVEKPPAPEPVTALTPRTSSPEKQQAGLNARQIVDMAKSSGWFTAGVISLLIAAILFGAAIVLFANRGV
jgi:DNA-binding winged helix-turn-helix (wHTH) protein